VVLEAINFAGENTAFDMDFGGFSDAMLPSFKNIDVDDGIFWPQDARRPKAHSRGTTVALG
jgi:hypothetical protein